MRRTLIVWLGALALQSSISTVVAGDAASSGIQTGDKNYALSDLLALAIQMNREIAVERTAIDIQDARIVGASGIFDPEWSMRTVGESRERAQNIREIAATDGISIFEQDNIFFQTGLSGRIPFGTRYELMMNADRLKNSLNDRPQSRYRPEYDSDLALTITQPLLRDAGRHINRIQIYLSESEKGIARLQLQKKILEVGAQIVQVYADLIYAQGNVQVRQEAIEVATRLKEENQKRVELGVMKPIDVLQAEAAISVAEDELIRAEVFLAQRQNVLKALVFENFEDVIGLRPYANEALNTGITRLDDIGYWIGEALKHNPDYQMELKRQGQEDRRVEYAKNQTKPRVDLQGSLGVNGLSDSYGESLSDFGNRREPEWTAGVVIRIPLGNREAKARLNEAKLRRKQSQDSIQFSRNSVISALDSALGRVRASKRRLGTIAKTVELAASTLVEEQSRLEEGLTTSYEVLQMQEALADARARRLAARADIMKSIAEVHQVSGRIPQLEDQIELIYDEDSSHVFFR